MADTDDDAFKTPIALQRRMSPGAKLLMALKHPAPMMRLAEAGVRMQYPLI